MKYNDIREGVGRIITKQTQTVDVGSMKFPFRKKVW